MSRDCDLLSRQLFEERLRAVGRAASPAQPTFVSQTDERRRPVTGANSVSGSLTGSIINVICQSKDLPPSWRIARIRMFAESGGKKID